MVDLKASSSAMIATTLMEMAAAAPAYLRLTGSAQTLSRDNSRNVRPKTTNSNSRYHSKLHLATKSQSN